MSLNTLVLLHYTMACAVSDNGTSEVNLQWLKGCTVATKVIQPPLQISVSYKIYKQKQFK